MQNRPKRPIKKPFNAVMLEAVDSDNLLYEWQGVLFDVTPYEAVANHLEDYCLMTPAEIAIALQGQSKDATHVRTPEARAFIITL